MLLQRIQRTTAPVFAMGVAALVCAALAPAGPDPVVAAARSASEAAAAASGSAAIPLLKDLTPEEQAWLAAHPVVTLSIDDDYHPKSYRDQHGELAGINIDYVRLLATRLGIEIRLEGSPWTEALGKAFLHKVDGVVNADLLEERRPYLNFTEVYAVYPQALLTRRDEAAVSSLDEFVGRTVAVVRDTSQLATLRENHSGILIHEVDDTDSAIDLLVEGKVDGVFDDLAVLYDSISARFLTNLKLALVYSTPPAGYARIGVRNNDPLLLSVLNKAVDSITDSDRRAIELRWLGIELPRFSPGDAIAQLALTDEEQAWLHDNPAIHVASDRQWAPIEFLDESGQFQGIAIDYLHEMAEMLGLNIVFVQAQTWQELERLGRAGKVDVFTAIARTEKRARHFEFTEPYLSFPVMLFARDEVGYVGNLRELHGQRVVVVRSYAIEERIKQEHPEIAIVRTDSVPEALDMLQRGEVAVFAAPIVTASHYLSRQGFSNIKVVGETPYAYDQRIAIRSDAPLLVSSMRKAFAAIPPARRHAIYQKWVSLRYDPGFPFSLVWKLALGVLAILLLILFWNYRLARAVSQRTAALSAANEAVRTSEERAKGIISSITDPLMMMNRDRVVTWANGHAHALFGDALVGKPCHQVFGCTQAPCENCPVFRALSTNQVHDSETQVTDIHGKPRHFWCTAGVAAHDEQGRPNAVVEILRDITERKQNEQARRTLEEQLRQAQKMEAVGQLAGGIAHDFNNLLQVIRGNIELIVNEVPHGSPEQSGLEEVDRAAERATTLVRQLLTFARREKLEQTPLDLNEVVSGLIKMIRRLIGEHIEMVFEPGPGDVTVFADRGQVEQVILNLCVNARDAMPQGGRLVLEVERREISEAFTSRFMEAEPGRYVVLSVADSGTGVHPDIEERIFEPFFTTKGVGEGTGLGLATVYAIVTRHLGFLDLESRLGHGATFRVYLPAYEPGMETLEPGSAAAGPAARGHNETILIAEDDDQVRLLAERILKRAGYRVLLARDGDEALAAVVEHAREINLVILDVVMPRRSGGDVYAEIQARFPSTRVLLMSGYSFDVLDKGHLPAGQPELLRKPFRSEALLRRVQEALAR